MIKSLGDKTFTRADALTLIISFIIGMLLTFCELNYFCSAYTVEYLAKSYEPSATEMVVGLYISQSMIAFVIITFFIRK